MELNCLRTTVVCVVLFVCSALEQTAKRVVYFLLPASVLCFSAVVVIWRYESVYEWFCVSFSFSFSFLLRRGNKTMAVNVCADGDTSNFSLRAAAGEPIWNSASRSGRR